MLNVIARTRPRRSPSRPNVTPPQAAPTRNNAVIRPIHVPTNWSCPSPAAAAGSMVCNAGRATSGKIPISNPSNIQPRNAAARTNHCPRVAADGLSIVEADSTFGSTRQPDAHQRHVKVILAPNLIPNCFADDSRDSPKWLIAGQGVSSLKPIVIWPGKCCFSSWNR